MELLNLRMLKKANTTMIPIDHRIDQMASLPTGLPLYRAAAAFVTIVNGLASAIGWSQSGIVAGSTNADDTNVIGNIQMKPAEFAASTELTDSPISAWTQLSE